VNILYISMFSDIGGGEISLLTLINNLDRRQYNPVVACYNDGPFIRRLQAEKINYVFLRRSSFFSNFSLIFRLVIFMKQNAIDLMHVNGLDIRAAAASAISGVPMVGHLRVIYRFGWVDRLSGRLSRAIIMVSRAVREHFCALHADLLKKGVVIPNAVDFPVGLTPADLRKEYHMSADNFLIGIVGRLDAFKGHDVFIEAAAIIRQRLPNVRFMIVGETAVTEPVKVAYLSRIRALIKQKQLEAEVIFTGFRQDALMVMAGLDILMVPSHRDCQVGDIKSEGFGRVAVEAMAVGVPVIVSRSGGLPEIVEDKVSGLVVEPADAQGFAEAALMLLEDRQKREAMVEAGKKRFAALYTAPMHARSVERVYEGIL
jgi:glycosyltransferase involved in cell wall biosynthesis